MKTRTLTILVLATLLTLVGGTVAAKVIRTPFTGTSVVIDWQTDPEGRFWEPGPNMHWRGEWPIAWLQTTDSRITGRACSVHAGNYRPSPDDPCYGSQGTMHGTFRIEQDGDTDCWNAADGWEGNFHGIRHPDGLETFDMNLKGFGKYTGLQARFHEQSTGCGGYLEILQVEGEITDPGGK